MSTVNQVLISINVFVIDGSNARYITKNSCFDAQCDVLAAYEVTNIHKTVSRMLQVKTNLNTHTFNLVFEKARHIDMHRLLCAIT